MKRKPLRRYRIVTGGIAIGLLVAFWALSLTESPIEALGGEDANENEIYEALTAGESTGPQPGKEGNGEIPTDLDAAKNGALLNQQAMNAWHIGDIRQAMSLFQQAIDAAPNNPAPHSNYGRLLTLMTAYQQALPLLERARDLTPNDAQAWLDLATLYERAQVLEKSWEARAKAANLVGTEAITRDEQGRFIVMGGVL